MTAHTPGLRFPTPLHVYPIHPDASRADLNFPNGEIAANCGTDREVAEELARRWNAYPDLLAACERVLVMPDETAMEMIRSAIARAKGGAK